MSFHVFSSLSTREGGDGFIKPHAQRKALKGDREFISLDYVH